jgi:hypothetical protein
MPIMHAAVKFLGDLEQHASWLRAAKIIIGAAMIIGAIEAYAKLTPGNTARPGAKPSAKAWTF